MVTVQVRPVAGRCSCTDSRPGCGSGPNSRFITPAEMMPSVNGGAPLTETMMSPGRSAALAAGDPGSTAVMNSGGSASCGAISGQRRRR